MQEEREESVLTGSPSFRRDSDDDRVSSAAAVHQDSPQNISAGQEQDRQDRENEEDDSGEGFEFAFVLRDPDTGPSISADEIFSNGQIRPVYPVFNRNLLLDDGGSDTAAKKAVRLPLGRLLIEEREEASSSSAASSSTSSDLDELEGVPPGTYCVWTPNMASPTPARCRKSRSTGSSLRWRLRDLVMGRSHSDGKEKFVFLAAEEKEKDQEKTAKGAGEAEEEKKEEEKKGTRKGKKKVVTEVDMVTAHRMYYGRSGEGGGTNGSRRSFLPYKQDLVGLFANVNGLSRTHHPF